MNGEKMALSSEQIGFCKDTVSLCEGTNTAFAWID
jgi:hypothetical protein